MALWSWADAQARGGMKLHECWGRSYCPTRRPVRPTRAGQAPSLLWPQHLSGSTSRRRWREAGGAGGRREGGRRRRNSIPSSECCLAAILPPSPGGSFPGPQRSPVCSFSNTHRTNLVPLARRPAPAEQSLLLRDGDPAPWAAALRSDNPRPQGW